jgi:hypothetical protein
VGSEIQCARRYRKTVGSEEAIERLLLRHERGCLPPECALSPQIRSGLAFTRDGPAIDDDVDGELVNISKERFLCVSSLKHTSVSLDSSDIRTCRFLY